MAQHGHRTWTAGGDSVGRKRMVIFGEDIGDTVAADDGWALLADDVIGTLDLAMMAVIYVLAGSMRLLN